MSKSIKFWSFRHSPWQTTYKTLADVPDGVRCVVIRNGDSEQVRIRSVNGVFDTAGLFQSSCPEAYRVLNVLGISQKPEPKLLSDVPLLRGVTLKGHYQDIMFFVDGEGNIWHQRMSDGSDDTSNPSLYDEVETVLDFVAELTEVKA